MLTRHATADAPPISGASMQDVGLSEQTLVALTGRPHRKMIKQRSFWGPLRIPARADESAGNFTPAQAMASVLSAR
jgi:hypothetical protein